MLCTPPPHPQKKTSLVNVRTTLFLCCLLVEKKKIILLILIIQGYEYPQGVQGSAASIQHPWVIMAYLLVKKLYSNDQKEYITFVSK